MTARPAKGADNVRVTGNSLPKSLETLSPPPVLAARWLINVDGHGNRLGVLVGKLSAYSCGRRCHGRQRDLIRLRSKSIGQAGHWFWTGT